MDKKEEKIKEGKGMMSQCFIQGIIVNEFGNILFVKEKEGNVPFGIPKGSVSIEESFEEFFVQKIYEEMNMRVSVEDKLSFSFTTVEGEKYLSCISLFSLKDEVDEIENETHNNEYKWFDLSKALDMELEKDSKDAILSYKEYKESKESLLGWRRCLADFENFKKRQEVYGREISVRAVEDVVLNFLPVIDNFSSSIVHVPKDHENDPWVTGITYIHKQLEGVLREIDVEEIEVKEGDVFDPEIHEAIENRGNLESEKESEEEKQESSIIKISKIIQKGYRFKGKIIRPARVAVL
ncbi:MAG: nucleotide exchange factor GrpE [Candidatus Moraniibacteriota bacterium]|nr:MAG: nucleotide exchange factor GrpE [Candidatus Moranbacteria bacterium]